MTTAKSSGFSNFFNKHKKIFYFFFICLSLFLTINTVALRVNSETNTMQYITSEEMSTYFSHGYGITYDEKTQKHVYTPINGDPQINVPVNGEVINKVTVYFTHEVPKDTLFQVYYSYKGEPYIETQSSFGAVDYEAKSVSVIVPESSYLQIRLDINATFSIDRVECIHTQINGAWLKANFIAISALAVIIALSIVFEKHFGFYSFVKSIACNLFSNALTLFKDKKYFRFAVRVLNVAALTTLAVSYVILLLLVHITPPYVIYIFVVSIIAVIAFLIDMFANCDQNKAAAFFLAIALILGFMFSFSIPPTSAVGWDDEFHYNRSNELERLILNKKTLADNGMANFWYTTATYRDNPLKDIERILIDDEIRISADRPSFNPIDIYKKLGYIPSATVMLLGDLVDADLITVIVLSRMASILLFVMVVYLGIKRLKSGAYIFASIVLVPTSVYLASFFSYDYWVTAFTAYSMAYFISELQQPDKKLALSDTVKIFGSMILACGPKAIYCFLMIPALFMGKNKFTSSKERRNYLIIGAASIAIVLASFALPFFINTGTMSDLRGGEGVNAGEQVVYILTHPFEYAKTLFKFLFFYVSLPNATTYLVSLAYLGFSRNALGYLAVAVMTFCALLDKSESDYLGKRNLPIKLIFFATTIVQLMFVATSLYISFTPVGATYIGGCQYRYILPIIFLPLYAIGSSKFTFDFKNKKRYMNLIVFSMLSLNLILSLYDVYIKLL